VNRVNVQDVALGVGIEKKLPIQWPGARGQGLSQDGASGKLAANFNVGLIDQATGRDALDDRYVGFLGQGFRKQIKGFRDGAILLGNSDQGIEQRLLRCKGAFVVAGGNANDGYHAALGLAEFELARISAAIVSIHDALNGFLFGRGIGGRLDWRNLESEWSSGGNQVLLGGWIFLNVFRGEILRILVADCAVIF